MMRIFSSLPIVVDTSETIFQATVIRLAEAFYNYTLHILANIIISGVIPLVHRVLREVAGGFLTLCLPVTIRSAVHFVARIVNMANIVVYLGSS